MVEFIKTYDYTLVNCGNFSNYIILSPLFLFRKKYLEKMLFEKEWAIPVCLGNNDKNLGGGVLLGVMSKIELIKFFDSQMYLQ